MDKFEEYIKARYPVDYEHLKEKYPNVPVGEFYGDEKDLWNYRQADLEEKDKRIESALYVLKGLKAENDLWGCDQVEVQIEILEKALRGKRSIHRTPH